MQQLEHSYTGIETASGFLFFTHTTEGNIKMHHFLQCVADYYFDPHFNLGPVHVYSGEGVPSRQWPVNPGENALEAYPYCPMDKPSGIILEYQNEMKPTSEDFRNFCHNARCDSSLRNTNITGVLESIADKDRELSKLSRQNSGPNVQTRINDITEDRMLLDKLLKQYYDVRGHRSVEKILSDPMDSVVVDGVRLFTPHRQVLTAGHGLFLPGEVKNNPSHSYAWVNEDFSRIEFSKEPPGNKQVFQVKTTIEKALDKKQNVKKKNNIHPKL